jgi:hypothetical protein
MSSNYSFVFKIQLAKLLFAFSSLWTQEPKTLINSGLILSIILLIIDA